MVFFCISDDIANTLKERFGVSTPSVNKVTKIDDVSKSKTVAPSTNKTSKPNTELPDAGDNTLVARLSALPVIGLGFGLLLRRRNREE